MLSRKVSIRMTLISLKATQTGVCGRTLRPASSDCGKTWSGGSARLTWATHHQSPIIRILSRLVTLRLLFRENWDFLCSCDSHLVPLIGSRFFLLQLRVKRIQYVISVFEGFGAVAPWRSFIVRVVNQLCDFGQRQRIDLKGLLQGMLKSLLKPTWLIDWTCLETNLTANNDDRLDIQWAGCVYFPHDWFVCFVTLCPIRGRFWRRRPQVRTDIETWNFPRCKISTASVCQHQWYIK